MIDTGDTFGSYNVYLCMVILYLAGAIASAGGIGGGGVNVPLLLVIGNYDYHDCVVLSICTVLGNHCAQSYINWPVSHPYVKQRSLIYWDLILFLLPAQLGGSNIGVLISDAAPELLLLICAFFILLLALAKTYHKGMAYHKEERKSVTQSKYQKLLSYATECENESRNQSLQSGSIAKYSLDDNYTALIASQEEEKNVSLLTPIAEEPQERISILSAADFDFTINSNIFESEEPPTGNTEIEEGKGDSSPQKPLLGNDGSSSSANEDILLSASNPSHTFPILAAAVTPPNSKVIHRKLPYQILQILAAVFLAYVAFFLVLEYTVEDCSMQYYIIIALLYPFLLYYLYWSTNYAKFRQQNEPFYSLVKGDVNMEKQSFLLIFLTFTVGVLSSLLGIGGGELMAPLFLSYHLLPPVSTATTSMMSLLNTSNNVIHYAIAGDINYAVAIVFFFVGLSAGATGRLTALYVVNKYKKSSILVWMLFTILSISACLLVYEIVEADRDFKFHALC